MAIKLSSNPTCVLSDADNLTAEQRQKINMNLTKGIPGSNISGDKVTVINSDGEVEMKAYSAGGGGGSETPCIVDWANLSVEEIFSVVRTAIAANQPVFAKYKPKGLFTTQYFPLASWDDNDGYTYVMFRGFTSMSEESMTGYELLAAREGATATPEKVETEIRPLLLPEYSSAQSGDYLLVGSGKDGNYLYWGRITP